MKRSLLSVAIIGIVAVGFSGCGSADSEATTEEIVIDEDNPPAEPIYPYKSNTPPATPTQTN